MVNIGKISEAILSQKYLGSVIKQVVVEGEDEEEGQEDPNEVRKLQSFLTVLISLIIIYSRCTQFPQSSV